MLIFLFSYIYLYIHSYSDTNVEKRLYLCNVESKEMLSIDKEIMVKHYDILWSIRYFIKYYLVVKCGNISSIMVLC